MTAVAERHGWLAVEEGADTRVVVAAAVGAVGVDLAVRSEVASLGGALCVMAVSAALAWTGRIRNAHALAALAVAPVFGAFLALRQSPWLVPLDIAAVAFLWTVAASYAKGGSLFDAAGADVVARGAQALVHGVAGGPFALEAVPRGSGRQAAVLRGLAVAAPLVLVVGLLLASGDAVFASLFADAFVPESVVSHLLLGAIGVWGVGGLLRTASAEHTATSPSGLPRLGYVETCVVLGALVAVYTAFAVAQVVAASEGGRRVLETAGLTYAEYARSGFFQLLAVATLTLAVLPALGDGTRTVRALSLAAVALTLLIVGSAVRRLALYEEAFGLTMLRLFSTTFAVWVGAVFLLLGARLLGVGRRRRWFLGTATAVGLAMVLLLNVLDAEALVARRNAGRSDFDPGYHATLSDDAVPALVDRGHRHVVCPRPRPIGGDAEGWAAWNLSRQRAEAACAQP